MKQFKSVMLIAFALLVGASTMTSCKKGEQDPFLSLSSRKARMEGNYTVTSGNTSGEFKSINDAFAPCIETTTGTVKADFNGEREIAKLVGKTVRSGCTVDSTSSFTLSDTTYKVITISFTKDGSYTWSETVTPNPLKPVVTTQTKEEGIWNFTGGIGDVKSKEQIVLNPVTITTADTDQNGAVTSTTETNQTENSRIYNIIGLRKDEIVLSRYYNFESANEQQSESGTIEYTLTEE